MAIWQTVSILKEAFIFCVIIVEVEEAISYIENKIDYNAIQTWKHEIGTEIEPWGTPSFTRIRPVA